MRLKGDNMAAVYSVPLGRIIEEFRLEPLYMPEGCEKTKITVEDVNRPGLQLAGFFDYFVHERIQLIGLVENEYVSGMMPEKRREAFGRLLSKGIPALIIARGLEPFPECLEMGEKYAVPILRSGETTAAIMSSLINMLSIELAPRITRHGVLVEIYGEGVLILGESGVGKSETAIELVKRGHRLIADDAVEIRKIGNHMLIGSAPELLRHYIELRGVGVIDVRRIFGMGAIKQDQEIDLVVNMEPWQDSIMYDRLGLENQYTSILNVKVPSLVVPIKPGRNLAVILEVAAMNNRQKKLGYNAARDFTEQVNKHFDEQLSAQKE